MTTHTIPIGEPHPEHLGRERWLRATRPAFLSITAVGYALGVVNLSATLADWLAVGVGLIAALLLHAAANVINDVADADNGTDAANKQRIFPFTGGSRFIQNGVLSAHHMHRFAQYLILSAMILGTGLWLWCGWGIVLLGMIGVFVAWAYSMPPLKLNSRGLGEGCVFVGFGLLPIGSHFVGSGDWDLQTAILASSYALLTTALLYINQFPDRQADARAGKRHWVTRLSLQSAPWGYVLLCGGAYLAVTVGSLVTHWLPLWSALALLTLPLSARASLDLLRYAAHPQQLGRAIRFTILAAHLHGVLLAVGVWLG